MNPLQKAFNALLPKTVKTVEFEKTRFLYFPLGSGNCVAAYRISSDRNVPERTVEYAFSFCVPEDNFVKSKGRLIALGRLTKGIKMNSTQIEVQNDSPLKSVIDFLKREAYAQAPKWRDDFRMRLDKNGDLTIFVDNQIVTIRKRPKFSDPNRVVVSKVD